MDEEQFKNYSQFVKLAEYEEKLFEFPAPDKDNQLISKEVEHKLESMISCPPAQFE